MLENVEGLLKHEKGNTFKTIIKVLNELNYKVVGVDIKNGEIKYDRTGYAQKLELIEKINDNKEISGKQGIWNFQ